MKIHPVINLDRLAPYKESTILGQAHEKPSPVIVEPEDEQWEVEYIDNSKYLRNKLWYHVKFRGYALGEDAWQPAINLADAPELIKEFHRKNPQAPGPSLVKPSTRKSKKTYGTRS